MESTPITYEVDAGSSHPVRVSLIRPPLGPSEDPPSVAARPLTHIGVMVLCVAAYFAFLRRVEPDELGVLGLASVLPIPVWLAMAGLLVGFSFAALWRPAKGVLVGYVLTFSALLHGLAAIVYEYPRFPWAWKHVGVVDFIQRHNAVDPAIESMNAYHSWPGFFGLSALVTESGGLDSPLALVAWAPVFFNLAYIGALVLIFRSFSSDERLIWSGALFFTIANWVGQDYFAPQAIAYLFFLTVIGILLHWFPRRRAHLAEGFDSPDQTRISVVLLVVLLAVVVSHQLTPTMVIIAAGGLAMFRTTRLRWPAVLVAAMLAAWMLDFALPFTLEYIPRIIADLSDVASRVDSGLIDRGQVDVSQRAVSITAQTLTLAMVGLAGLGYLRSFRAGVSWRPALVLLGAPVVLVIASSYGDEILFRAFLFSLPMLALLAASLWFSRAPTRKVLPAATLALTLVLLLGLTLVAKHGNDLRTVFRPGEVEAATYLYESAPPDSLVIQLSASSPIRFRNYENITEVAVEWYSPEAKERVVADAQDRFARWGVDGDYEAAYVLLTKSQSIAISRLGRMPAGAYEAVVSSLDGSEKFELIYSNDDSLLYRLDPDELA